MKALIVDEKSENLYSLESLLSRSGYEIISARNGVEAFGLAKKLEPDIIISDILMPVMDGYAFCLECKKDLDLRNIPFVFYTATYTDPRDEEFSLSLGADRFILKPQDPDVFLELIKDVLSESKMDKPLSNIPSNLSENTILLEYNAVLIRRLEDKMKQTEENENKLKNYVKELENSIEQQKKTEKALRDSEEKFRVIVEATNDALYQLSYSTMKYDYINPAIEKLTGYSASEINSIGFKNIVVKMKNLSSEDISIHLSERKRIEGETEEWKADYLIKTKNGELKWISDHSFPSYDDNGLLIGSIGVLSDITERELATEEYIRAKENAEEMNRLKSNFLNNMSHELRTPLIGILGFAELLKEELVNPEHIKMAKDIYSGGKRLSNTLNLILDFSDLESKNLILTNVDTVAMVKKCIKEFLPMAANKNLKLDLIANTENTFASLDEHIFVGILQRLIDNAIKFTPSGSIIVEINNEIISNKPWISIKVKDTGIGIDEGSIDLIYDEFRQGSEGFSRNFEGTGLGLAIAKKCVTSMGGNIAVESKKGVGSVFTVKFPAAENIFKEKTSNHEKSISKENVVLDNKDLPLLLYVENDTLTINIIKILLKDVCKLELAENGKKAIQMAQEIKFDGFLMDINLGRGLNGMDVTKEIKKMPQYVNTPIIALTAYAMARDKEEILKGGCTHYLAKPFKKEELIELIQKVV